MSEDVPVAVDPAELPERVGIPYPAPYDAPCRTRAWRRLGAAFGLTDFGVNLTTLPPGAWSSQRHWHSAEDELIYVVAGTPKLVTDAGETRLRPGMCAGFKAGVEDGHHFVNDTDDTVTLLEIGSSKPQEDVGHYAGIDMKFVRSGGPPWWTRKDGSPIGEGSA